MFTLAHISKLVTSVLGIAPLLSQPVSSTDAHNVQSNAPTFTQVYEAVIPTTFENNIPGPFGGRVLGQWLGGNFTNTATGALAGRVVPGLGGELGLVSNVDSKHYPDISIVIQWVDDQKFAFLRMQGIGSIESNGTTTFTLHAQMETDSPSRQNLVESFLLTTIVLPPPTKSSPNVSNGVLKLFAKSASHGVKGETFTFQAQGF
ncbi:hypothetical protein GYMLUDRAFT_250675 [Collybiopsis luxurians FD-317 M1]|uniref:NADH:ubiquinone oxidoreductase intermediate-associated protein 30 domain-containing protein n=1 Tax=Collybiopsis luxurians FD-317 M1 TaxID=944289 RepID=A0A0D0ARU9_9AGAR|nr:hypothetical protein GYMLUDRAFT_250675 [Collybiopsis luxurians FD-317 M1]